MMYTNGKGIERAIVLPEGKAERAAELLMREDWAGLETEFEIYCLSKAFYAFLSSVLRIDIC
jgi:hypothetical protein